MSEATAAKLGLNITYRQLDHWTRLGYLHPVQRPNRHRTGTGYAREWDEAELEIARAMGRMVRLGLTPAAAHKVARAGQEVLILWALA